MYNFDEKLKKWKNHWLTKDIQVKESYYGDTMFTEIFGVRGFLTPGDVIFLWDIGLSLPAGGKYLEVGSWQGLSSVVVGLGLLAKSNFSARISCVDVWELMPEQSKFVNEIQNSDLHEVFLKNIEKAKMNNFVSSFKGKSTDIAKTMENNFYDTIFIDGDHSYEGCYEDLNAWYPKLKTNGKFIGHDAVTDGGVEKAVKQFCRENDLKYSIIKPPFTHFIWEISSRDKEF